MDWKKLLSTHRLKQPKSPSKVAGDERDEFDRDLDRVVYSTPFRRLQDKTQVFPLEPNDSVRTRLTHSLEVSQAARGTAKHVCPWLIERGHVNVQQAKCIETIAATCGLVHDLGNPPFGHSGELAIRDWFRRTECHPLGDLDGTRAEDFRQFGGNAQTFRLVTRLQILADFYGLNLTCGTLSAACKYTAPSDSLDKNAHERSKVGYFASEKDTVEQVRQQAGTGEARNPIAFLVEAADDAVYNAVDLEDGFRKGILDWGFLKTELEKCAPNDDMLRDCVRYAEERMELPEVDLPGRAKDNALIQYFRVRAIGRVVTGAADAFKANYGQIIEGDFHHELVAKSSAAKFVEACRNVNRSFVYCSDETLKLELMGRRIIKDLMDIFWEGAANPESDKSDFPGKAFSLLSDNYRSVFDHARKSLALPERYYQLQLVTDYVCGMTDNFAAELHRRLTNG